MHVIIIMLKTLKLARRDYEEKIRRLEIENNELSTFTCSICCLFERW